MTLRLLALVLTLILSFGFDVPARAQPASPVDPLVGQTATLCGVSSTFEMQVLQADWQPTLLGVDAAGMWVVVIAEVTNTGDRPDLAVGALNLQDEQGRVFPQFLGEDAVRFAVELPETYGVTAARLFPPGAEGQAVWVYDVPSDVTALKLAPLTVFCP